jgi:hypothetical protein
MAGAVSPEGPGGLDPRVRDWIPTRRGVKMSEGAAAHFNFRRDTLWTAKRVGQCRQAGWENGDSVNGSPVIADARITGRGHGYLSRAEML